MPSSSHNPPCSEQADDDRRARFVELLNENQSRLFGFLYANVLNMADAEDLYQQVAMVLWTKFDQFEPGSDFGAWGVRVADFTIKNFLRGKRRSKLCFGDEVMQRIVEHHTETPAGMVTRRVEALRGCLKKLPQPDRVLLEKCYSSEASVKEVAGREGRSPGALYTALNRIRRALLGCIERTLQSEASQ